VPAILLRDLSRSQQGTIWSVAGSARGDCDPSAPFLHSRSVQRVLSLRSSSTAESTAEGVTELVDSAALRRGLYRARRIVDRHAAALTRLDAVLGDGDHGENLAIGFRAVEELLAQLPKETLPGELLRAVGHRLVAAVGGASGPLYGTAFIEAGFAASDLEVLDPPTVARMLQAASNGIARRGRCAVGDKTILDTLAPAASAYARLIADGAGDADARRQALRAAVAGMRSTRPLVARRGLALRLGSRSAGHLDPGAVSCLLLLLALGRR
jgi:phosphoenolpyruvate---glycerone phosphotransferase subunit DhaL